MARRTILNLDDDEYEHPFDHKALETLEKTPLLDTVIHKAWEKVGEDFLRVYYTGSCLRVTEGNYPELYRLFREAYGILNVQGQIELYLQQDPMPNAFTIGVTNPVIGLTTKLVDLMSDDELIYVIGHELGHIKSKHTLYHQTAQILTMLGGMAGNLTFGIGDILTQGVQVALLYWQRMSEYTADRAGLLACQDIGVATSVNMKFAGIPEKYSDKLPVTSFIEQAKEFKRYDIEKTNMAFRLLMEANPWWGMTHPWVVLRAAELMKWQESGEYDRVMRRETFDPATMGDAITRATCPSCGKEILAGAKFCRYCGSPVSYSPIREACPSCGIAIAPEDLFCPSCGAKRGAGTPVKATCPQCGVVLDGDTKFCRNCGHKR